MVGNRLVDQLLTIETMHATTIDGENEQPGDTEPACGELFAFSTLFPLHDEVDQDPLFAYAASADPDTMYYHEAMKEEDSEQFKKAMVKEFMDQWDNGNFDLKQRSEVPDDARILPAVWQMKRKRKILTGEVYKHKAHMNLDGSRQIEVSSAKLSSPTADGLASRATRSWRNSAIY